MCSYYYCLYTSADFYVNSSSDSNRKSFVDFVFAFVQCANIVTAGIKRIYFRAYPSAYLHASPNLHYVKLYKTHLPGNIDCYSIHKICLLLQASYQAVVVQAGWQVCLNLPGNAKKEQYLHAESYMVAHFLTDYSVIQVKEAKRGNVSTVIKKRFFWFNIGTMYVYLGKSLIYSIAQLWHHLYRLRRKCSQL